MSSLSTFSVEMLQNMNNQTQLEEFIILSSVWIALQVLSNHRGFIIQTNNFYEMFLGIYEKAGEWESICNLQWSLSAVKHQQDQDSILDTLGKPCRRINQTYFVRGMWPPSSVEEYILLVTVLKASGWKIIKLDQWSSGLVGILFTCYEMRNEWYSISNFWLGWRGCVSLLLRLFIFMWRDQQEPSWSSLIIIPSSSN